MAKTVIGHPESSDLVRRRLPGRQARKRTIRKSTSEESKRAARALTGALTTEIGRVGLTQGGHGWVTFSLDGRFAWCHTHDVIDVRTRKIVASLKDENGGMVNGSKFIEVHFRDGKVVELGDQFGLGRAHLKMTAR